MSTRRRTRSARKRSAILDAATTLFLRNGYRGTSMDEIAALAGVSKQTVYKHFADKESLFSEIVTGTVERRRRPGPRRGARARGHRRHRGGSARPGPPAAGHGDAAADPAAAPAGDRRGGPLPGARPHLLRAGPRTHDRRAGDRRSSASRQRGALQLDDPQLAAAHFNWLVMSIPLNEAMLLGQDEARAAAELDRVRGRRRARVPRCLRPPTARWLTPLKVGPAPQSIPFASRVRCLVAPGACRRRTALGPGLLAAGPASNYHPTLNRVGASKLTRLGLRRHRAQRP